jgi:hypothetical protein
LLERIAISIGYFHKYGFEGFDTSRFFLEETGGKRAGEERAVAMTPDEWEKGDSFIVHSARKGEVLYAA